MFVVDKAKPNIVVARMSRKAFYKVPISVRRHFKLRRRRVSLRGKRFWSW